ncbi:MAG: 50S ribosomal protein L25 [Acidobacteriota bacterium]|jgi:large subunit ribosomal protein L25
MAEIVIEAAPREAGSSNEARRMRRERKLPAIVYGGGKESLPITLDPGEIVSILKSESGQNTIFKLKTGDGGEDNVMIFDVQIDPITHTLLHADLARIAMDVEIEVSVPIRLIGEPKGVVEGGVLDHSLRELEVSCLPGNIPESIDIDVSHLEINDSIKVADLVLPPDVTLETDLDYSVASVVPPVSEEDLEADLGIEGEEPEVVGEELGEGEEAPEAPEEEEKAEEEGEEEKASE